MLPTRDRERLCEDRPSHPAVTGGAPGADVFKDIDEPGKSRLSTHARGGGVDAAFATVGGEAAGKTSRPTLSEIVRRH
jgi:hypothetical protein